MQKTSKIEAVNAMLTALGSRPVNSIDVPRSADVDMALSILDEASREIQQRGWHFNTNVKVYTPDSVTSKILLPANTMRVDATRSTLNTVQRGDYLYDETNETYEFEDDIELEVVLLRDWEELPQPARTYIMLKAVRKMLARVRGPGELQSAAADEAEARADLEAAEASTADYNIFHNWAHFRIIDRIGGQYRRGMYG